MKLTEEGERLRRYCVGALELEAQVMSTDGDSPSGKPITVTVAGPTSIMSARIIPGCFPLYEEFPNLLLNFRLYDEENRVDLLKKGDVDLAIVSPEQVRLEMDSKVLKPDRYVLVASSMWKGRRIQEIVENERIIDFHEKDETTHRYLKKYRLFEVARKDRLFANANFAVISMIKAELGYGTLTEEVASSHVENGELILLNSRQTMEQRQALIWYPRNHMPIYLKRIIQSIK
jgi:DNA-binding transcriptional LysR family regulator